MDLYCIISQSLSQSVNMCTQTRTLYAQSSRPRFRSAEVTSTVFMSCEKSLFFMWCAGGGGAGGGGRGTSGGGCGTAVSHQCSSHAVGQSQPRRVTGRNSKKCKYLQLEGHPNLFPHILVLISASGLHVQRTNPQPEMKRATTIWE